MTRIQWRSQTFAIARAQLGHQLMWYAHTLTHQQVVQKVPIELNVTIRSTYYCLYVQTWDCLLCAYSRRHT